MFLSIPDSVDHIFRIEKKLDALEMWCYRRLVRLPWTKNDTNEEVMTRVKKGRTLMKRIRKRHKGKRQLEFFGFITRNEKSENLNVTGKIEGERSSGSQRSILLWKV